MHLAPLSMKIMKGFPFGKRNKGAEVVSVAGKGHRLLPCLSGSRPHTERFRSRIKHKV